MKSVTSLGRFIGLLLLFKMISGLFVNFVLLSPVYAKPGFMVHAGAHPSKIALAVMLEFIGALASMAIFAATLDLFRRYSPVLALWFGALTVVSVTMTLFEGMTLMSMLSFSQTYLAANGANADAFAVVNEVVKGTKNWAHFTGLLVRGSTILVLCTLLYRARMVPRLLAGFGVLASVSQLLSVSRPFFGQGVILSMLAPLALAHLLLIGWLLWKGLPEDL